MCLIIVTAIMVTLIIKNNYYADEKIDNDYGSSDNKNCYFHNSLDNSSNDKSWW